MWDFADVRNGAITQLSKEIMQLSSLDKIECGRSYDVPEWLSEGYVELVRRQDGITDEEAERLGWKTTAKLFRVRELLFPRNHVSVGGACEACHGTGLQALRSRYCSSCDGDGLSRVNLHGHAQQNFTEAVQKEFSADM
jgi:hypothetical protein